MTTTAPPRWFKATDILSGQVQLHSYPMTFVAIGAPAVAGQGGLQITCAAAELLESQGWRVVNFTDDGKGAYLRREHRPAPAAAYPAR